MGNLRGPLLSAEQRVSRFQATGGSLRFCDLVPFRFRLRVVSLAFRSSPPPSALPRWKARSSVILIVLSSSIICLCVCSFRWSLIGFFCIDSCNWRTVSPSRTMVSLRALCLARCRLILLPAPDVPAPLLTSHEAVGTGRWTCRPATSRRGPFPRVSISICGAGISAPKR